ncbi:MAG: hypothetical protein J0J06_08170 [Sphingomonas sp.]|uniref:hypothetical protein n=1 Tax=Sphingomonas sp. TaxID=28214 RepID=UPI001AC5ED9D|nr:hypothetical protein [Sphingomonas sp.]MBN8815405.1 hypothetical protein [Sphingomonas sp.]
MRRWLAIVGILSLGACSGLGQDGPSQEEMSDALARRGEKVQSTERIACKAAPSLPGYICDFKTTVCSAFTKKCDKSQQRTGRFVQVSGSWMFMGDVNDPGRGTIPPPEPTPSEPVVVTDLGETDTNMVAPTPTASPSATPTPKASPTAKPSPTPSPSATPSPKPTASPTAKPVPTPAGVNNVWLSGRWGAADGDCAARRAVKFGGGGGFYGKRGIGRWSLKGKTVTVTGTYSDDDKPFEQKLSVERTGDDAMTMEGKRYHRCPN